jgi:hypothetical protein
VIIFGLVQFLYKKNNQTDFFFKKTKSKPKPVLVRFFGQKPIQTGLA